MLVVSLDTHANETQVAVVDDNGEILHETRVKTHTKAFHELAGKYPTGVFIMEASSTHEIAYDSLMEANVDARVFPGIKRERRHKKTDREDAIRLARRFLAGELREVYIPPEEIRRLKSLITTRQAMVRDRNRNQFRIKHLLKRTRFAETMNENPFSASGREQVLERFPHLRALYEVISILDEGIKTTTKRINDETKALPATKILRSIPGFGPIVSAAYYCHVWDPHRFKSTQAIARYFGLDPESSQSGERRHDLHRISKQGPDLMRTLLTQAAWVHVRIAPDSSITHTFNGMSKEKGRNKAIMRAVRELAEIALVIWKENRNFTMTRPTRSAPCLGQA